MHNRENQTEENQKTDKLFCQLKHFKKGTPKSSLFKDVAERALRLERLNKSGSPLCDEEYLSERITINIDGKECYLHPNYINEKIVTWELFYNSRDLYSIQNLLKRANQEQKAKLLEEFKKSNTGRKNFFEYMEDLLKDPIEKQKAIDNIVVYLSDEELEKCRVTEFKNNHPFVNGKSLEEGEYLFVLMLNNSLYITKNEKNLFHSSLSHSLNTRSSGVLNIDDNNTMYFTNSSGHYKPDEIELGIFLQYLQSKNVDLNASDIKVIHVNFEVPSLLRAAHGLKQIDDFKSFISTGEKKLKNKMKLDTSRKKRAAFFKLKPSFNIDTLQSLSEKSEKDTRSYLLSQLECSMPNYGKPLTKPTWPSYQYANLLGLKSSVEFGIPAKLPLTQRQLNSIWKTIFSVNPKFYLVQGSKLNPDSDQSIKHEHFGVVFQSK